MPAFSLASNTQACPIAEDFQCLENPMQPHRSALAVRPCNDQLSNNGTTRESKSETLLSGLAVVETGDSHPNPGIDKKLGA